MRKVILIVVVALAALFVSTTAAGPPTKVGSLTIKPLPKPGKAAFFTITLSGPLQSGVTRLTVPLYLELDSTSHVTGKMQVAYIELKPVISGGKATVTFLLAANNPRTATRLMQAQADDDALSMIVIGASLEWTPAVHVDSDPCAKFKQAFQNHLGVMISGSYWLNASHPGSSATGLIELALGAAKRAGGC